MQRNQITLQVSTVDVATWASELALDERFAISLETQDLEEPSADESHPMYSLEYLQVVNIVIQTIGVASGLIAIYDKIIKVYEERKTKPDPTAGDEPAAGEPVLIIDGKRYLLKELPREKVAELETDSD